MRTILWPLFARSTWSQPATVSAGNTVEGAALASVRLVAVGPASHCGGGYDRGGRWPGLFSLVQRRFSQALWLRAREVRALQLTLFSWSAWPHSATLVAGTTFGRCLCLYSICLRKPSQPL
jgi:hypothetical protein